MDTDAPERMRFHSFRRPYERILLVLFWAGLALASLGSISTLAQKTVPVQYTTGITAVGVLFLVTSFEMALPLRGLRTVWLSGRGSAKYERQKHWTQVKVGGVLLSMLAMFAAAIIIVALGARAGWVQLQVSSLTGVRTALFLSICGIIAYGYVYYHSLRIPLDRVVSGIEAAVAHLMAVAGIVGAFASFATTALAPQALSRLGLATGDLAFLLLAGVALLSIALHRGRDIPSLYSLFTQPQEYYRRHDYVSRNKSVMLPAAMAFALLFLILFGTITFELGLAGLAERVPTNLVLLGVFVLIAVGMIASVIVSIFLSRSEDRLPLITRRRSPEARREITILAMSAAATTLLLLLAAALRSGSVPGWFPFGEGAWIDVVAFAILAATGPYGFYYARKRKEIRELEERFPDFLRDIAASRKAGLTMVSSVQIAARGEYGALTKEIQKMADQLSWNISFEECLERFRMRVHTPLIERAVTLILEAGRTGGHVTDVLEAAAQDAREIKTLESKRRSTLGLYTVIIYITFFVFLLVAAVLYGSFLPEFVAASEAAVGDAGSASFGGLSLSSISKAEFRVFYYTASMVQGVGNGFIAGLIESGRARAGLRHGFFMTLATYLAFAFMLP